MKSIGVCIYKLIEIRHKWKSTFASYIDGKQLISLKSLEDYAGGVVDAETHFSATTISAPPPHHEYDPFGYGPWEQYDWDDHW